MTEAEKRLAQQRAFSVAACAAVVVVGGPVVGYRVELHKADEAYIAEAVTLASRLNAAEDRAETREEAHTRPWLQHVSHDVDDASGPLDLYLARARDTRAIDRFASFDSRHFRSADGAEAEMKCLSEAIYYEAGSESVAGKIAVAEVILNRVADPHFPKSICEVVYEGSWRATGCQFTFTCDGSLKRRPRGREWEESKAVALHVKLGLAPQVTNDATHYHANYVDPYWSPGMVLTATIGKHLFYRLPKTGAEWRRAQTALAERRSQDELLLLTSSAATVEAEFRLGGEGEAEPGDLVIQPDGAPTELIQPAAPEPASTAL